MSDWTESNCGICGQKIMIPEVATKANGIKPVCYACFKVQKEKKG